MPTQFLEDFGKMTLLMLRHLLITWIRWVEGKNKTLLAPKASHCACERQHFQGVQTPKALAPGKLVEKLPFFRHGT